MVTPYGDRIHTRDAPEGRNNGMFLTVHRKGRRFFQSFGRVTRRRMILGGERERDKGCSIICVIHLEIGCILVD